MTVTTTSIPVEKHLGGRIGSAINDSLAVAWRNLLMYVRLPQLLVFSTIQPVILVLMFRYVFGGAIDVQGDYVNYLMPGVFAQVVAFGAMGSAVGLATDSTSGLLERFKSLPMARIAVLAGRTSADFVRNIFVLILMTAVGYLVGFRIQTNLLFYLYGLVLILLFGYTMSWIFATIGLLVKDPETAQAAVFPAIAPLVFASAAFVPVETMPGWLQVFAEHQPLSVTVSAARALVLGGPTATYVFQSLGWCIGILIVFVPIAIRRYSKG